MSSTPRSFKVGIDFQSVLGAISKQIYETPLAFIRENVQNAVDAIRIQAVRDGADPADVRYKIKVTVEGKSIAVRDNGTGMSQEDLQNYFWTIGASGKRTNEARQAGCVGMFGIGGFANFGVCDTLEVASQVEDEPMGTTTRLSEADIQRAGGTIPDVQVEDSCEAAPRGTIVRGSLREVPKVDELRRYLQDFVRYVPTEVLFNDELISQRPFSTIDDQVNLTAITAEHQEWAAGDLRVKGQLFEDRGHSIVAAVRGLTVAGEAISLQGRLRFEAGVIDAFKRGFKLCATSIGTAIGVSGRLDCDRFVPTAGRDSLDSDTTSLLSRIVLALEAAAVEAVLASADRVSQHTRVFRYVIQHNLIEKLGRVQVRLADGSESSLGDIQRRAADGGVQVFFGTTQKQALNQIMQARGHIVVLLSSDRSRQQAERLFLQRFCAAKPFDGVIACSEHYPTLSRFEQVFLSELELTISKYYEVAEFKLVAGKLTEDIPVYVREYSGSRGPDIFVDVRHSEISKLESLGFSPVMYSLIATFCREYLGPSLKKWSPRFFGDGAINLSLLAKRRSELWVLLSDDIGVVRRGGHRHVFRRSDVREVSVGGAPDPTETPAAKTQPRILHLIGEAGGSSIEGFYIRMPNSAFIAYGDLLPECDSRGLVWAGNKITYVASDTVSAAFQYEIRLDEVVSANFGGEVRAEGALSLDRPLQQMFDGLYFPIPSCLEAYLVPKGANEIRVQLHCDWIDMRTAKHWTARDPNAEPSSES